jgi:diguanylate cyclase (GGDEF)-like protein
MMSGESQGIGLTRSRYPRHRLSWWRKERALHHLIWIGIAITSIGFATGTAWMALQSRSKAMGAATASVQNLALVLDKHIARTIDAVDTLIQTALHEGRDRAASLTEPSHAALMTELTKDLPYVKTIELMSENGEPFFNLRETSEAGDGINLETYVAYRENPGLGLYVSRPRRDGASRTWLVGIARRGTKGSPSAGLIAVVHIDIEQLQHLFEEIDVGRTGALALWRADGMLLTRKPYEMSNVGRSFPTATLFREMKRAPVGVYEPTVSVTDGLQRIIAYRSLPATSLIIAVALGKEEVLAQWRRDVLRDMAIVGVAITLLISFGVLVAREAQRRDAAEAGARQKSRLLEATLDNMDQGLIMFDADLRVQVCNRRAMELLDLPASLMLSRPLFEDIKRYEFDRGEFGQVDQDFQEWVRSQRFERTLHTIERERPDGTVLEVRTAPFADGGAVRTYTDITERKVVEKRIAHMARHDSLTGLPNRVLLRERIEEALARVSATGETLAVLCLDLDQFKAVNDTLGHPVGDVLLEAVAERIEIHLSEGDTVARLGGDEFAILQVGQLQPHGAKALAQRLVQCMPEPFFLDGHKLNIGVSVGIALAPCDGLNVDSLLKCADLALYRAKAEGRDTFRFFEPAMDTEIQVRRAIETDMREALTRGEFQLHYQPFMNIAQGEVVGFEALLRWNHPSREVQLARRVHRGGRGDRPHRPVGRMDHPARLRGRRAVPSGHAGRCQRLGHAVPQPAVSPFRHFGAHRLGPVSPPARASRSPSRS